MFCRLCKVCGGTPRLRLVGVLARGPRGEAGLGVVTERGLIEFSREEDEPSSLRKPDGYTGFDDGAGPGY